MTQPRSQLVSLAISLPANFLFLPKLSSAQSTVKQFNIEALMVYLFGGVIGVELGADLADE